MNIINTNARSLKPKITSLLECLNETDTDVAIITESWLRDSELEDLRVDLSCGSGFCLFALNRPPNNRGVSYGGVALVLRESFGTFSEVKLKNAEKYEVLVVACSVKGHRRKFVFIAAYLPPGYDRKRGKGALDYVEGAVIEVKRRYQDPYVFVGGDFNQWNAAGCLANFANIKEVCVGNTRGSRAIDRLFLNVSRSVIESGILDPLETEAGEDEEARRSDHKIVYCKVRLSKQESFKWETYCYRHFNDRSAEKFREWVVFHDWASVLEADTADGKAEAYQATVVAAVESFFPLRKVRKKSSDPPWLDKKTKDLIEARKQFYIEEGGRTDAWKLEKKKTEEAVKARKRGFLDIQREKLLSNEASRNFYRQVKNFGVPERPKFFDVREMMPATNSDHETAEQLAEYFNRVSDEFDPLGPGDIPCTRMKDLPILHEYEVAGRIRRFKKPRSTVPGDIFPQLVTQFADFLAVPLADIFNKITTSKKWPKCWKKEYFASEEGTRYISQI